MSRKLKEVRRVNSEASKNSLVAKSASKSSHALSQKRDRKLFLDLLFLVTNLFLLQNYLTGRLGGYRLFAVYGGLGILYLLSSYKLLLRTSGLKLYGILTAAVFIVAIKLLVYGDFDHTFIANIFIILIVGIVVANSGLNKNFQLIFLVVTHFYIAISYLNGVPPSEITDNSHNHVSVILLYSTVLFYLSFNKSEIENKEYSLLPAISCCILCVFSIGRAGILVSFTLFFMLVVMKFYQQLSKANFYKKVFSLLVFITLLCGIFLSFEYLNNLGYFSQFVNKGYTSEGRVIIINTYLDNLDGVNLLIGNSKHFFVEETGLTAHISYLAWHNSFGIIGIVLLVYTLEVLIRYYKISKYHMVLLFTILARSATDNVLLYGSPMFGILMVFLIIECERQTRINSIKPSYSR